jgi:hypothetical protein
MYIGYIKDRQDLGFMCLKDIEDGKQITLILKTGVIYITITILINSSLFMNDQDLINQSYSDRPSHERIISSISNQKLNTLKDYPNRGLNVQTGNVKEVILVEDKISSKHLINGFRGGNLTEDTDQNSEQINESLKESVRLDKLQKNLVSKSVEDSESFTDKSFNKIVIGILDKMEPIIGNPKFLRILAETQKPVKSELSISVQSSSKDSMDPKPQKISAKRSSSMFAEALVPVNPRRWPAFAAGSAMASDMPDLKDKLQTPLENLRVAKEYLETAQSDLQWRARLWQVAQDTTTLNFASEQGGDVGSFGAGAASNKIADGYMAEMIDTEVTKNQQEKLNLEIFKQTAREQGKDVSKVRGTGLMREFVPDVMQEDVCKRPERNARPNSWEDTGYSYDDSSSFN